MDEEEEKREEVTNCLRASNTLLTWKWRSPFVQKKMPPWEFLTSPGELAHLYQAYEEAEQLCAEQARGLIMKVLDERRKTAYKSLREILCPENNYPCFLWHLRCSGLRRGMLSAPSSTPAISPPSWTGFQINFNRNNSTSYWYSLQFGADSPALYCPLGIS